MKAKLAKAIADALKEPPVTVLGDVAPKSVRMYDAVEFDDAAKVRIIDGGYLVASPRIARTGIQVYSGKECNRPDVSEVRVYRPEGEVFADGAARSYTHLPVTMDHPPVPVDAKNWKQYSVGQTGDEVLRDGGAVRVPMMLRDAAAIQAFKNGINQLSVGYDCDLDWTPGVTADGQQYDALQKSIRANHLAVVAAARGGPTLKIGDDNKGEPAMTLKSVLVDGIACQMDDTSAAIVNKTITALQNQIDAFKKKGEDDDEECEKKDKADKAKDALLATKDAEIATLKAQLKDAADPARLDALVRDRATVFSKAKALMGDSFKADGKTAETVRREVVDARLGDVAKGWTDDQVAVSFNTLTAGIKPNDRNGHNVHDAARAFSNSHSPGFAADARETAYDGYNKDISEAWRGKQ